MSRKPATSNVVTPITAAVKGATLKPDSKLADDRHAADRARILDAIDTAEDLYGTALVEALKMTAQFGRTSSDEVKAHYTRCNNPAVYSSWFNLGHRAQEVIGVKATLDLIERACNNGKGAMFDRCKNALGALLRDTKESGVKTLDGRKATTAVKAAVAFATDKSVVSSARKADAKKATRGAQGQRSATMGAAAMESGRGAKELAAAVKLCSQNASRMPEPEGRESAWREAVQALQLAAEKLAVFGK